MIGAKITLFIYSFEARCMVGNLCFLFSIQHPSIHLHRLRMLVLGSVKSTQVVDNVESKCMIGAPGFLESSQRQLVHFLRLNMLALISIEAAETVGGTINLSGRIRVRVETRFDIKV